MKKSLIGICLVVALFSLICFAPPKDRAAVTRTAHTLTDSLFPKVFAGFGITDLDIFKSYASWTNTTTLKTDDTFAQVLVLGGSTMAPLSFLDMNGDGLVDVIYTANIPNSVNKYAVFLNNGNRGFDLIYKCYMSAYAVTGGWAWRYYGDCAG